MTPLTYREFVDLVETLRKAQRAWFRDHDHQALTTSKRLEREVDKAIKAYRQPASLFPTEDH